MNPSKTLVLALCALVLAACGGGGGGGDQDPPGVDPGTVQPAQVESFVHRVTVDNRLGALSRIDHPLADGNPNAYLFVTQLFEISAPLYSDLSVVVRYIGSKWFIQSANGADDVPLDLAFNVTIATDGDAGNSAFGLLDVVPDGVLGSRAFLDHPAANGNPNAVIILTTNVSPRGVMGPDVDVPLSVLYVPGQARWGVYNRSGADLPDDMAVNYAIVGTDERSPFSRAIAHEVTADSMEGIASFPDLPDELSAIVHLTQVFHGGIMPTEVNAVIYYTRGWGVLPQDVEPAVTGHIFNMVVVR